MNSPIREKHLPLECLPQDCRLTTGGSVFSILIVATLLAVLTLPVIIVLALEVCCHSVLSRSSFNTGSDVAALCSAVRIDLP